MTSPRRAGLAVALLVVLSGCMAGGPFGSTGTDAPTERPVAAHTEKLTDTPAPEPTPTATADDSDAALEQKPLPEHPGELTAETAVAYAERYAAVVTYNRSLGAAEDVQSVSVDCGGTMVNETAAGYQIRVDCGTVTVAETTGASKHSTVYLVDGDAITEQEVRPLFPGSSPAPQPLLGRPEELTGESVVDYVERYEVVRAYNDSLGGDTWYEYWRYSCSGSLLNETDDGHHVRVTCGGGLKLFYADWGFTAMMVEDVTYFVDETTTAVVSRGPLNRTPTSQAALIDETDRSE